MKKLFSILVCLIVTFVVIGAAHGGSDETAYNVNASGTIVAPFGTYQSYGIWYDRDTVDPWQDDDPTTPAPGGSAVPWGSVDGGTYNTLGIYEIAITYHAVDAVTATMFATINGIQQGFWTNNYATPAPDMYPAGLSFTSDMTNLQVFHSFLWNSQRDTGTIVFNDITATQGATSINYNNATYAIPSDGIYLGDFASQLGNAWNLMNGDLVLSYTADFHDTTRLIDPFKDPPGLYDWSGELFAIGLQGFGQDAVEPFGAGWLGNFMVNPLLNPVTLNHNEKFDLQFNNALPIPEPSTILLFGAGLAGVGLLRRRFKK
jgi:hypothetical protein